MHMNSIDFASCLLNITLLMEHKVRGWFEYELLSTGFRQTFASIAVFLMYVKGFHWCRLFPGFAFYNRLIGETLSDSLRFMILYVLIICGFANVMYIINFKRIMQSEDLVVADFTSNNVFNSFAQTWNLGLGDFDLDNYSGTMRQEDLAAVWIVFFGSTFIVNIVFLNMLIAIMSDTFDKVTDLGRDSIELQ